jgi:ABC-type sugar transport system ATPase subunit
MKVELVKLTKKFGSVTAVDNMNLAIDHGELVAFLGPSGCGKTTTLLMNAGIYRPTAGEILFDGKRVNELIPRDRDIGMVFQSYALYPHMSVYQNIVFSLTLKKVPKDVRQKEAKRVAEMLGIGDLLNRKPAQLSGGQQQRVALGRALIKEPGLLLFDEPLSNLDARLRISMRAEIKKLQRDLGITSIYVTHDQIEAMTMADRIAVMNAGILQAFTTPADLHDRPKTLFIAQFIGNPLMNFMPVRFISEHGNLFAATTGGLKFEVPKDRRPRQKSDSVIMGIRPQDIKFDGDIETEVFLVEPMGRDDLIICHLGDQEVSFLTDPNDHVSIGDRVKISFDMSKCQFFDSETEMSLLWN